jgi:zinc-ribbon family/Tellurite resistance protein TerB
MIILWGFRVFYRTVGEGVFHCRKCGGDRQYRHRAGRRFFTLFFIPIIPLNKVGEHVQCTTCKTRYVMDALSLPTAAQMQTALPLGMRAAAVAVLQSGDPGSPAARQRAVAAIRGAGAQEYTDADLDADAAQPADAARSAVGQVARQLTPDSKEWFLAEIVRVGMADGPLTERERQTVQLIAADLGMTQAQAIGVVTMTEQAAQQN